MPGMWNADEKGFEVMPVVATWPDLGTRAAVRVEYRAEGQRVRGVLPTCPRCGKSKRPHVSSSSGRQGIKPIDGARSEGFVLDRRLWPHHCNRCRVRWWSVDCWSMTYGG